MEITKIKDNIKDVLSGKFEGDMFLNVYEDENITSLKYLKSKGINFTLKPKVGDMVLFQKYYKGIVVPGFVRGIVTKNSKSGYKYMHQSYGEIAEVKGKLNFGSRSGYVLRGFLTIASEEDEK